MGTRYKTICHICKIPMDDHSQEEEDDCLDKFVINERRKTFKGRKNKNGNIPQE